MADRISLVVGFSAMTISMAIGVFVGTVAGSYVGVSGAAIMRVLSIIMLIAMTSRLEVARVVEARIRFLKTREYAQESVAMGAGDLHVVVRRLLPNAMAPIVVTATLNVAHVILAEGDISFLGYPDNRDYRWLHVLPPLGSKQDRASQQSPKFEQGEIWMPSAAPWRRYSKTNRPRSRMTIRSTASSSSSPHSIPEDSSC
jgi:peptide/nickel transport system permease protein